MNTHRGYTKTAVGDRAFPFAAAQVLNALSLSRCHLSQLSVSCQTTAEDGALSLTELYGRSSKRLIAAI